MLSLLPLMALATATRATAPQHYLDLVGEQGFAPLGVGNISNAWGVYEPESGTSDQLRLCDVIIPGQVAPADEKKNVHNTFARTILSDGTRVPLDKSPLLARPTSFELLWTETAVHKAGTMKFSIWKPECPDGFSAIGDAGTTDGAAPVPPATDKMICVADVCTVSCDAGAEALWSAAKNVVPGTASLWSIANTSSGDAYVSGCNRFHVGPDKPEAGAFRCLKKSCLRFSPYLDESSSAADDDDGRAPSGVHLALGFGPSSMSVGWQTFNTTAAVVARNSVVQWWQAEAAGDAAAPPPGASAALGDVRPFTADAGRVWFTHTAIMTGLAPSTRYSYRVGSNASAPAAWSKVFTFVSAATAATVAQHLPQKHVIIGDLGSACAFSMCPQCNCSTTVCDAAKCHPPAGSRDAKAAFSHASRIPGLKAHLRYSDGGAARVADGNAGGLVDTCLDADMILHVGDYGYNLDSDGGKVGDQFMRNIEQIAAYVPYMTSIGNHEDGATALAHYTERFRQMPSTSGTVALNNVQGGKSTNTWFYSWDAGLVHYVAMSTEIPFGISGTGPDLQRQQYEWIAADLAAANKNRDAVPWVVVHGHRSIYCSCDADCDASAQTLRDGPFFHEGDGNRTWSYEDLFFTHGVDLFINGHEHDYERNFPIYRGNSSLSNVDPKATIYIVTGAAGCDELHEPFTRPQPPRSAFRSNNFGYSQMIIHNSSHLQFQQVMTDPTFFGPDDYGRIIDDVMIVQSKHGPFDPADAPTQATEAAAAAAVEAPPQHESHDHWAQILRDEFGADYDVTPANTAELIRKWRQDQDQADEDGDGDGISLQWKAKEDDMKLRFEAAGLGATKWEDVRMDGSSDGAVFGDTPPELIPGLGDPRLHK